MSVLKRFLAAQRYSAENWAARLRKRSALPLLAPRDRGVVDELRRDGGAVTSLEALGVPGTDRMLLAADRLAAATVGRPPGKGGFIIQPSAAEMDASPELIRWGLDERLLAIVANYLGLPAAYRGVTMRRDIAGGGATETRLWHCDDEDFRIVKIIVYLNDVGLDGGPYEFIPKPLAPAKWRLPEGYGRIEDADMKRWTPAEQWRPCTGQRGTAVFTDTCSVLHRGRIAQTTDRLTLFFCYNSIAPVHPQSCRPLFDRAAFRARNPDLSATQEAAIAF
ncbi:MAG: 2OG-Fe(II) oxygenase [Alphaproteobacteria bacterium]|nr:2OG-Fe(II) oxygenase [Alphaproteobacteria bacterium]